MMGFVMVDVKWKFLHQKAHFLISPSGGDSTPLGDFL